MPPRVVSRAALLAVVAVHLVYLVWTPYLNHDVAAYVSAAQVLLRGGSPGLAVVDTNPPMIVYLSAVPAALAGWLHLPVPPVVLVCLFAALALGGVLFARAAPAALGVGPVARDLLLALWFAWSLRVYWSIGPLAPEGDFGQRDMLLFAWLAPWVVVRYARHVERPVSGRVACLTAVCAVAAIGMKPFFLVPLLACELLFVGWTRRPGAVLAGPEWWVLAGGGAAYVASFAWLRGAREWLFLWLPQVSRGYAAYSASPRFVLGTLSHEPYSYLGFAGVAILCSHPWWPRERRASLPGAFGVFGALSLALFAWQSKGWLYQRWPYDGAVTFGAALLLADSAGRDSGRARLAAIACACGAVLVLAAPVRLWPISPLAARIAGGPFVFPASPLSRIVETLSEPGDRVLALSTNVADAYPALTYTGRLPATRFVSCAFPVSFYFSRSADYVVPAEWRDDEAAFYAALQADVHAHAPRLVFVHDAVGQALPAYFRMREYLRRRGFFSTTLGAYEPVGRAGVFVVYVRADAPTTVPPGSTRLSPRQCEALDRLRRLGVIG